MMSRKKFIGGVIAAGVAPSIVPNSVFGAHAPSNRITVGAVGCGNIARNQLPRIAEAGFQVVALCDVDSVNAKQVFDKFPNAPRYVDFREMLRVEGDKIDAVYCGTPDHTHTVVTLAALASGKHVCCVKPLTRSVEECRVVIEAARKAGTATQVTASAWTEEASYRLREYFAEDAIGDVSEVHAWSIRPVWPQGMPAYPDFTDKVPDTLDWDLWLGPAAKRPFAARWPKGSPIPKLPKENWIGDAVYHPFNFRGWFEFGAGALGDMGCHRANTLYKVLDLKYPTRVEASSSMVSDVAFPVSSMITFDYPARGTKPPVRLMWYDGGLLPPKPKEMGDEPLPKEGVLYIGTKGKILFTFEKGIGCEPRILDPVLDAKFKKLPRTLKRREGGMFVEWLEACKGGEPGNCNFDWAQYITEFTHLGNLALRTGRPVKFDPVAMKVEGNDAANKLLKIPYHNGWALGA